MRRDLRIRLSAIYVPCCLIGSSAIKDYCIYRLIIIDRVLLGCRIDLFNNPEMVSLYRTDQETVKLILQCYPASHLPAFMTFSYRFGFYSFYYDFWSSLPPFQWAPADLGKATLADHTSSCWGYSQWCSRMASAPRSPWTPQSGCTQYRPLGHPPTSRVFTGIPHSFPAPCCSS